MIQVHACTCCAHSRSGCFVSAGGMRRGIRARYNSQQSDLKMTAAPSRRGAQFAAVGVALCSATSGAHAFNVAFVAGRGHVLSRRSSRGRGIDDRRIVAPPVRGQASVAMSAEGGPVWRWGQATASALAALQVCVFGDVQYAGRAGPPKLPLLHVRSVLLYGTLLQFNCASHTAGRTCTPGLVWRLELYVFKLVCPVSLVGRICCSLFATWYLVCN